MSESIQNFREKFVNAKRRLQGTEGKPQDDHSDGEYFERRNI